MTKGLLPPCLTEDRCRRHGWWILVLLGIALYLPGLNALPLIDRDEPRFAQATVEMMERGTWVIPYFNGDYRFDKPPLTYWWMRVHYWVFGVGGGPARLHSVVSTILTALVIFGLGRSLYGARAGFLGGLAWLASLQVLVHGRLAVADMPMVLSVAASMWAAWELLRPREGGAASRWWWLFWGSLSFGFLAKGPIAWLVAALALATFAWFGRRTRSQWRALRPGWGVVVMLLPVALWGLPALVLTDGAFWSGGMVRHVWDRGFESFNERPTVPGYYFVTVLFSLFPWAMYLPGCLGRAWEDGKGRFLLGWFAAPFVIFLFYTTQLPHYILPGFPAFFVLLGGWGAETPRWGRFAARWSAIYTVIVGGIIVAAVGIGAGMDWSMVPDPLPTVLILVVAVMALLLVVAHRLRRGWSAAVAGLVLAGVLGAVGHELRSAAALVKLEPDLRTAADRHPTSPILGWNIGEPGLVFYGQGRLVYETAPEALAEAFVADAARPAAIVALVHEWQLDDVLPTVLPWADSQEARVTRDFSAGLPPATPPGWRELRVSGINFGRTSWVRLQVWIPED